MMDASKMRSALKLLDNKIKKPAKLLLGGGGAMVLAYDFPLATLDMDALFFQSEIKEADVADEIQEVALELNLPRDWLNPYFSTFLFSLPQDYSTRLVETFKGKHLIVYALGLTDLLILKCYAGREKDIGHARALIKKGADTNLTKKHIQNLLEKRIPKSQEALDFLFDLLDELEM